MSYRTWYICDWCGYASTEEHDFVDGKCPHCGYMGYREEDQVDE